MRAIGIGQCSWDTLALVAGYPEPDTKAEAMKWIEQGGGPVATACAALTVLGVSTAFFGVTGDDMEGGQIRDSLGSAGVDTTGMVERKNSSSQTAFISVDQATAGRTIFWRRPTGEPLAPGELPEGFLDRADILLLDGLMKDISLHAAQVASGTGVPVMVDAGRIREGMLELCALSDYIVGSEEFARSLGYSDGAGDEFFLDIAGRFTGRSGKVLTITLGLAGSVTVADGHVFRTPAIKVRAVDTTGAGDVFHAGYAYGVMSKWDIRRTLEFATTVAGLSCQGLGGRSALPNIAEAMDTLNTYFPLPSSGPRGL